MLSKYAWAWREKAILNKPPGTPVGCAIYCPSFVITGANIEHPWCKSIHAEKAAIVRAVVDDRYQGPILGVLIAAECERFSPCGDCLDWIFRFGGPECQVAWESSPGVRQIHRASELMPFYPQH